MRLELKAHPVNEISPGEVTRLEGSRLEVDVEGLRRCLLGDERLESVDLEIVRPGEGCRVGYVFDIVEPRAKEPGDGVDFPGILVPPSPAGQGVTHVLRGAAVTVVDGGQPGGERGYASRRGGVAKVLEMSGPASHASPYGDLHHLVVVPHAFPGVARHAVLNALRVASVKAAVFLARAAVSNETETTEAFDLADVIQEGVGGRPRVAYIAQVHGHQHGAEADEHILYGSNTQGMMPLPLHPNEWLDGAVVISYSWGGRGLETYFYQNHPIIRELYRLHRAGEIDFVGTIATTSSDRQDELDRNCMLAAHLARWDLRAEGAIVTKYAGGAPHTDMFETARRCEDLGIKTVVLASDTAPDQRAESALLLANSQVDAVVNHSEGLDLTWPVAAPSRIIAGNPEVAAELARIRELSADRVCGVTNGQGASRLRSMLY